MKITGVTRALLIDQILMLDRPFHGRIDLIAFLKRTFDLSTMPSNDRRYDNAEGDIWQHIVNNNDWSEDYLLNTRLPLLTCDDPTFLRFLENCLSPRVVKDADEATALAAKFNALLAEAGYVLVPETEVAGIPIFKARILPSATIEAKAEVVEVADTAVSKPQPHPSATIEADPDVYEVVLSFAGEDRAYVEQVAAALRAQGVSVFYDRYEDVTLWGKDLAEHLTKVYRSARYCVMFVSHHYAEKIWTTLERRSALSRAVESKDEYVLPARFDDTQLSGLLPTIGYIDLRTKTPEQLAQTIMRKLGRST